MPSRRVRAVSAALRILRTTDEPTAQHPLVCRAGRYLLQPRGGVRNVAGESQAARVPRRAFRAVAAAPRAPEPRNAGLAVSDSATLQKLEGGK